MKKITKKVVLALLITVIVCLHLTPVFAVNSKTTNSKQEEDEEILLNNIEIEGFTLEPNFNKDIHQYTVETHGNIKNIEINANASEDNAIIKIIGNTNLIKGQNIVSILVSDEKEKNISTYQIYVNNDLVKPEVVDEHYKDANTLQEVKKWITIVLVIVIIICLFILKRLIRLKREEKEDREDHEEDNITNEETIKSIRKIRENYDNINKQIQEEAKKRKKRAKHGKHSK